MLYPIFQSDYTEKVSDNDKTLRRRRRFMFDKTRGLLLILPSSKERGTCQRNLLKPKTSSAVEMQQKYPALFISLCV